MVEEIVFRSQQLKYDDDVKIGVYTTNLRLTESLFKRK
jgi:hypothetical protein